MSRPSSSRGCTPIYNPVSTFISRVEARKKDTYRKANTTTINPFAILECNSDHVIFVVGMNNLHPFLVENIKSQLPDFASNQRPGISIELSRQHPFIPINQFDISEVL
jgi:hypothetical protein